MSMENRNIVTEIKFFKNSGDEDYGADDTLEIVEVAADEIEIAFDLPRGRVYLKFRLPDLLREAMKEAKP